MKSDATIEKIRARVDKVVDEHLSMQHIYKFAIKVGGEVKSTWILDLKNLKVFAGDDPNAECTLIIDDEDLFNIGNGTLGAQEALAQNKLDIEGNIELALKLVPFISSL